MSTSDDKLAVTELLYTYAELIDAGDFDGVGALLGRSTFGGPARECRVREHRQAVRAPPGAIPITEIPRGPGIWCSTRSSN